MTKQNEEALKMVNDILDDEHHCPDEAIPVGFIEALKACKEALEVVDRPEQPAQEPAYQVGEIVNPYGSNIKIKQPAQEPVAWRVLLDESPEDTDWHYMTGEPWECFKQSAEPLYTHPTQPLSNDEIAKIERETKDDGTMIGFARAIEQAHGIGITDK